MINIPIDFKSNKKQAMILTIVLLVMALVLYFNILLRPQIGRLTDLLGNTGKLMSDFKLANSDIANIDIFKKKIGENKEKVELYEKQLPVEHEIPRLLEGLSNLAKTANIKIISITPIPSSTKDTAGKKKVYYKEIPIRISAKSGYHELGIFLNNLEKTG